MAQEVHDNVVRQFLADRHGVLVYVSEDFAFLRVLRSIVTRTLGIPGEHVHHFSQWLPAREECTALQSDDIPFVIIMDRRLGGRTSSDYLLEIQTSFPSVPIILVTWAATKAEVAYLFELGVSRVLVKPVSANKIIEDLALAITPPTDMKQLVERCRKLLTRKDFDEALEVSDKILLLKPNYSRGLVMRGDALFGMGKVDKAVRAYIAAHELQPIYMAPLIKLAATFSRMEDERALEYLMVLDSISPLNPERKIEIAQQYLERNDPDVAETYMDQSMDVAEKESLSIVGDLTERIVDAVAVQAPELAVKYLNRVLDGKRTLGRDDLLHFNRLGIILRGQGKWEDAVSAYEKALVIAPDDPAIHYNMGLAYWEGGERMRGLRCFEQGLAIDPHFYAGSIGAATNIGSLYLELRQYAEAEPFFQHVLDLDPDNVTARKRLKAAKERTPVESRARQHRTPLDGNED